MGTHQEEGGLSAIEILLLLSWFGLVTGLGESYFLMAKTWLWRETVPGFREVSRMSLPMLFRDIGRPPLMTRTV